MTTLIAGRKLGLKNQPGLSTRDAAGANSWPRRVGNLLSAQRDRWILWLALGVIAGAALWLLAPTDPPVWGGAATFCVAGCLGFSFAAWPGKRSDGAWALSRASVAGLFALTAATGLGATAAQVRTTLVASPRIAAEMEGVRLEGWVVSRDTGARPRLKVLVRSLEGADALPRFVRVSAPSLGAISAGRSVRCRVSLRAPDGPLAPGAYDFSRRAYFERLGATGFIWGRCRPALLPPPPGLIDRAVLFVAALRSDLSDSIQEAAPGRGGDIAAALIAGDESAIDPTTNETLFNSGIGHLISVSGLHMAVVGGLVFGALSIFFSFIAPIALRWPVKKIAAGGALAALAFYLVLSGASVPAIRAFVMACVAFGAILIDRPAISMRGLALAAFIVTLAFPESVLEPGFQMSFAATAALVAAFEANRRSALDNALPTPGPIIGGLQWLARSGGVVLVTSLVAGFATDPFALFHFQRFAAYGLVANLAIAPIVSFVVAPSAALAAIAAVFGLAEFPLAVMAWALDLIAAIGGAFGTRPEAVQAFPRPPDLFLPLAVMTIAWACFWRGALRWGALVWAGAALAMYLTVPAPAVAFDGEMRAVFAREAGAHELRLMRNGGRSTFARDRIGAQLGLNLNELEAAAEVENCDDTLCAWRMPSGRTAYLVKQETAFQRACDSGSLVLSPLPAPVGFSMQCAQTTLIDARSLREGGALIYEHHAALRIEHSAPSWIRRPWTPQEAR
ncbi:MAG: ComEC/Rec2 family competence protein [Caulobacterales bacterium]